MSRPDFDGVYRTRPTEGVFSRKKRPETTHQATPQTPSKKSQTTKHKGAPPQPPKETPLRGVSIGRGNLGGDPTPVTPFVEGWVEEEKKTPGRKTKKPTLVLIEDTREQTPLTDWPEGTQVENRGLDTGDYSIAGWENCFAIERKSVTDLAGTMIDGYEPNTQKPRRRFNNELERMRHFDCAAVIVTATPAELIEFKHNCGMDAHAALWNFGLSIFATYGIPVFPLTDAKTAARWIYDLARHYISVRTKKNRSREDRAKKVADDWKF